MLLALAPVFAYDMIFGESGRGLHASGLPIWEIHTFATVLALSGIVGLVGCFARERAKWWSVGIRLEGGALALGAGGLLLFTYVMGTLSDWRGVGFIFTAAWTVANMWRSGQCVSDVRRSQV